MLSLYQSVYCKKFQLIIVSMSTQIEYKYCYYCTYRHRTQRHCNKEWAMLFSYRKIR